MKSLRVIISFLAILGYSKMEERCPICLEDVCEEDVKCTQCTTRYHADCKPADACATCRCVYDEAKKIQNFIALNQHFNDNLTLADIAESDEEDEDEDDDTYEYTGYYDEDDEYVPSSAELNNIIEGRQIIRPRMMTRAITRHLVNQGYDLD